jgi:hypothetical protein
MSDIVGNFVVKCIPAESLGQLRDMLRGAEFDCVELDGSRITDKASLHETLYRAMNFAAFGPGPPNSPNWDSLSDLLWQWVTGEAGHEVTKLAFVVENASSLLARDAELVFQFAEVCIQLENAINQDRREASAPQMLVRVFLVG